MAGMKSLVRKYKQENSAVDGKLRDQLIMDYSPLIRFVAQRIASRLPSNIDIEDLISSGVIGLMDAIDKYDPSRDNKFKTYAEFRIRGAILDELRSQDWVPRSVRDKAKKLDRMSQDLEQKFGRKPTDDELSQALGMAIEEFFDMNAKVRGVQLLSIDDFGGTNGNAERRSLLDSLENPNSKNPFTQLRNASARDILRRHIDELPEKQKLVLQLYYFEDLNLKEIGRILEVTESRVSQLHTQAIEKLKRHRSILSD
jgi:RNA polymerase sigma factor for flagellar operon FliA